MKSKIIEAVIADLKPYSNTPRNNDEAVPIIVESIKEFGFIGAIVYIAIAALVLGLMIAVLYVLEFYGVFAASQLFTESSPLLSGAFGVCDTLLRPLLETVKAFFTP